MFTWLTAHGQPIRYGYVERPWPIGAYQNVYAIEPGSAEMPSAGRPFTPEVITRLVAKGVGVSPLVLHTGCRLAGGDELPYPERFALPASTASSRQRDTRSGGRVIAVGTTVVRALETAAATDGHVHAVRRMDRPRDHARARRPRRRRTVDRLARAEASHLRCWKPSPAEHCSSVVRGEPAEGYLWHEFGDMHLILP